MECSTWSGAESLNLQFLVPKVRSLSPIETTFQCVTLLFFHFIFFYLFSQGISEEMFTSFSQMLSSIFRVSTPLDLTSTANR